MNIEAKIKELGLNLPEEIKAQGAYAPGVDSDGMIYTSGQTCRIQGVMQYVGKVGCEVSETEAYQAARTCVINCIAIVKHIVGDLDRVEKIVKMNGFVACDPKFTRQTQVINGASELLRDIFGDCGLPARSAIGVCALPGDAPCEIELIVKIKK